MREGKLVFVQLLDVVPRRRFQTCVDRHRGDWKIKTFYGHEFFHVMTFAQVAGRESLAACVYHLVAVLK